MEIQEAGVSRGGFGSYATGDRFRVEVRDGEVSYHRNGLLLYASGVAPVYPLSADTSLYDTGATLQDVVVSEIVWTAATDVTISAGSLLKAGSAGWSAGAASTATLTGDGFLEFTATETSTRRICGLADQDASYDPAEIDFAIQLEANADVKVYESGTLRGTFGTYAPGDRFRVEVRQGQVVYRKNGLVFYTSGVAPIFPLAVDAALDTPGATLGEVRLGNLTWKGESGIAVWGYGMVKTAGSGWGNSGAATTVELASGDGAVEYTATETTTGRMLGLSSGDSNQNYTDIDFGLLAWNGSVYVYEKGTSRGSFGTYAVGDRLLVAVEAGVVKYRRNGTLVYTSAQAIQYPLLVDTALDTSGVALADIVLSGPFASAPVAAPVFAPSGGTYSTSQTVTLTCSTPLAEIRYTTDGSEPGASSTLYTAPISIGTTTTLKAKGFRADLSPSTTTSATYQMNFGTLAAPVMTPGTGVYPALAGVHPDRNFRLDDPLHDEWNGSHHGIPRLQHASDVRDHDDAEGQGLSPGLRGERDQHGYLQHQGPDSDAEPSRGHLRRRPGSDSRQCGSGGDDPLHAERQRPVLHRRRRVGGRQPVPRGTSL